MDLFELPHAKVSGSKGFNFWQSSIPMNRLFIALGALLVLSFGCVQEGNAGNPPHSATGEWVSTPGEHETPSGAVSEPAEIPGPYANIAEIFIEKSYAPYTYQRCFGGYSYSCPEGSECDYTTNYSPDKYPYLLWHIEKRTFEYEAYHQVNCNGWGVSYSIMYPANFSTDDADLCYFRGEFANVCPEGENVSLANAYGGIAEMFNRPPPYVPGWCTEGHTDVCVSADASCLFNYELINPGVFSGERAGAIWWHVYKGFPELPFGKLEYQQLNVSGKTFYFHSKSTTSTEYSVFMECQGKTVVYEFNGVNITLMDELNQEYMERLAKLC
jgi:hypothetical protein